MQLKMKFFKVFFFNLLLLTSITGFKPSIAQAPVSCSHLDKIKMEVIDSNNDQNNGKIILSFPERMGSTDFEVHLIAEKKADNRMSLKLTQNEISLLKKGKYLLIIQESGKSCTKQLSFTIN